MTPQEKDLISQLLERLRHSQGPKDAEADAIIRQAMAAQPDAPYYLVQTVLIQDMALSQAQNRITELERQVAQAPSQPAQPTSFLGGLFAGGGRSPGPGAQPGGGAGPWGRPTQTQPPQPQAGPWGQPAAPQGYAPQPYQGMAPMMPQGASGGFLRQAAATAAGIAGGALLFQGIQSMFGGHHGGGMLDQASYQPGLSETVINNYYGSDADAAGAAPLQTASDQGGGQDYAAPDDYSSQDVASSDDLGGGDDDFA